MQKLHTSTVKNLNALLNAYKQYVLNNIKPSFYFTYSVDNRNYIVHNEIYSTFMIYRKFDNGKRRLYHTYYLQNNLVLENLDRGILAINGYKTDIFTFSYPITSYFIVNIFDSIYHIHNKEDITKNVEQLKSKLILRRLINRLNEIISYRNIPIITDRFSYKIMGRYLYSDNIAWFIFSMKLSI